MKKQWKKYCPFMKGVCVNGFVKGQMPENDDGERTECALFVNILGVDPQTGQEMNDPGCSIHFLPIIQLEGNMHTRQTTASTDKIANEVRKHHATFVGALSFDAKKRLSDAAPRFAVEDKAKKGEKHDYNRSS